MMAFWTAWKAAFGFAFAFGTDPVDSGGATAKRKKGTSGDETGLGEIGCCYGEWTTIWGGKHMVTMPLFGGGVDVRLNLNASLLFLD